ncbi:PepSY domain-containing protein [Roseibium sp. HPY-6]|uniref:PepSY domain-containing protein n=1 Tax=Roseibium sp. HPY-6 TaxID=3229852 RepID=UPI00338EAD19
MQIPKLANPIQAATLAMATFLATGTAASAQVQAGDTVGTSVSGIALALETGGYDIREIEVKRSRIEVEAILDGSKFEIKIDPQSGKVTAVERD